MRFLGKNGGTLYGQDYITDQMLGNDFPNLWTSLYQGQYSKCGREALSNSHWLLELREDDGDRCLPGIGTIGLSVANHVKEVYGVEVIPEAVWRIARRMLP